MPGIGCLVVKDRSDHSFPTGIIVKKIFSDHVRSVPFEQIVEDNFIISCLIVVAKTGFFLAGIIQIEQPGLAEVFQL